MTDPEWASNLGEEILKEYLLLGLARIRPLVSEDDMRILIQPNQGERGKKLWVRLMKSDNPDVKEAVAYLLTGMGIDPDKFKGTGDKN